MASIVVCGGGVIGLTVAMMLAHDGHETVVLEGDAAPVPPDASAAWEEWPRRGVAQFHQPHNRFPPWPADPRGRAPRRAGAAHIAPSCSPSSPEPLRPAL